MDDDDLDNELLARLKARIVPKASSSSSSSSSSSPLCELPNQAEFKSDVRALPQPLTVPPSASTNFFRMTLNRCRAENVLPHQLIPLARIPEENYDYDVLAPLPFEEFVAQNAQSARTSNLSQNDPNDDDDDDGDNGGERPLSPGANYDYLYTDPKRPQFSAKVHERMIGSDTSARADTLLKSVRARERLENERYKNSQLDDHVYERKMVKAYKAYCREQLNPMTYDRYFSEQRGE